MNFSESLTYWYLRLNGFFPLSNFVLHRRNIEDRPSADTDLLAIRFPHVFEQIGGQQKDWDQQRFVDWGLRLDEPLALIVEVKSGTPYRDINAWRPERLRAAIQRLGMFEPHLVEDLVEGLRVRSAVTRDAWSVAKLLVSNVPRPADSWLNLTLEDAEGFIRQRIHNYQAEKRADRLFFPDPLMQYFAWKG
jgi:hypothetical protein